MGFFGLLQLIDEVTMIRFMGRDLTIFLKYLNYQTWMFLVILIIQWTVLIPIYYTGEDAYKYLDAFQQVANTTANATLPLGNITVSTNITDDVIVVANTTELTELTEIIPLSDADREYNLIRFTILNVESSPMKMTIAFIMVIVTTVIVYL